MVAELQNVHHIHETAFNMSGFIQPSLVEKMLLSDDADGFNNRQLFVFPPQRDVLLNDLKQPVPPNIPPLKSIYMLLRTIYSTECTYTITGEAIEAFRVSRQPSYSTESSGGWQYPRDSLKG